MAIEVLNDRAMNAMTDKAVNKSKNSALSKTGSVPESSDAKSDAISVSITEQAKNLDNATALAKSSDGVDHDRVAELKQQISDGTYKIDYQSLANKIVDSEDELNSIF